MAEIVSERLLVLAADMRDAKRVLIAAQAEFSAQAGEYEKAKRKLAEAEDYCNETRRALWVYVEDLR